MEEHLPELPSFFRYADQDASLEHLAELHQTFVQNVSHELRTPLSVVLGYAQLLQAGSLGSLTEEQNQAIFIIASKARTLTKMVKQLGILMEIKSHNGDIQTKVSIPDIISQTIKNHEAAAQKAELALSVDVEASLPLISGNAYHLRHTIHSLLENAIKFTPKGGRIIVRAYADGEEIVLQVEDTGIGIPEEKLDRLLSGFYQVDGSTTRNYGGLGLGLTLVNAVVEAHDGTLQITSREDEGTICTVRLPATSPADVSAERTPRDGKEHRILIVDDEEVVGITLRAGLEKIPRFNVQTVTDGESALRLCEQEHFDLVITDYRMPDMNGLELSRRIRQVAPKTVIMFITAYDSEDLHQQAELLDVQQIIKKPFKIKEMREITMRLLDSTRSA